jgi:hypothetical protein
MSRKSESRELLAAGWGHRRRRRFTVRMPLFPCVCHPGDREATRYKIRPYLCNLLSGCRSYGSHTRQKLATNHIYIQFKLPRYAHAKRSPPTARHSPLPPPNRPPPPAPLAPLRRARRRPAPPGVPKNGRDVARYTRRCRFGSAGFSPVNSASRAALATPSVPARSIACCSVPPASSTATPS